MDERRAEVHPLVANWLRQTAVPIDHLNAGTGLSDLQPLTHFLDGVNVVGLGEATHGTREFFQLKHRLTEYLIEEMGFTAFALESSYAACEPINEFILHGTGDRAEVLSDQGYIAWDTEEFSDLLDWLRGHNARVEPERRVSFHGLDLNYNERGRSAVLAFVSASMPDVLEEAEDILEILALEESKWPLGIDDTGRTTLRSVAPRLDTLVDTVTARTAASGGSSVASPDSVVRYLQVMAQWVHWLTTDLQARSRRMGENLVDLIDRGAVGKVIVWAHNDHVAAGGNRRGEPNMGSVLRERYGSGYFAIGFECGEGAYTARLNETDDRLGNLTVADVPDADPGSLPSTLSAAAIGNALIPLREPSADAVVDAWCQRLQGVHNASWRLRPPTVTELSVQDNYDALAFVATTSPTRPTPSGRRRASNGLGL